MRGDRVALRPLLVSQTLISDSLPAPAPTLLPNSLGSVLCPPPGAVRHQLGLSLQSRVAAPEGVRDGPARPYLQGQREARAPGQSPGSPDLIGPSQNHRKHPAPLAGAEQLVGE